MLSVGVFVLVVFLVWFVVVVGCLVVLMWLWFRFALCLGLGVDSGLGLDSIGFGLGILARVWQEIQTIWEAQGKRPRTPNYLISSQTGLPNTMGL